MLEKRLLQENRRHLKEAEFVEVDSGSRSNPTKTMSPKKHLWGLANIYLYSSTSAHCETFTRKSEICGHVCIHQQIIGKLIFHQVHDHRRHMIGHNSNHRLTDWRAAAGARASSDCCRYSAQSVGRLSLISSVWLDPLSTSSGAATH